MSDRENVLVVDDEPDIRELLEIALTRMGLNVTTAEDLATARRALNDSAADFSFCLTDMRLPDGNGLDLVEEISDLHPDLPTAVITAHGKVEDAVDALKLGAFDFVSKPVDLDVLRKLVSKALKLGKGFSRDPSGHVSELAPTTGKLEQLIGQSSAIQKSRLMIRKLSRSQAPVLISGASGSGKELAAQLIHDLGPRAEGPFVPVNCGAIPTELMESEFFGHQKGSFTGAHADKDGLFQAADGGTLLLDEVADLPLHMQVKLLRAIQEKAVLPIGARKEVAVDVRILSATHKPLKPLVESGKFRSDLFFRLNVIELEMPDLKQRPEDIPLLAAHFLKEITSDWGADLAMEISQQAMEALVQHNYVGNVRELINILQRATTMCESRVISVSDLMLEQAKTETTFSSVDLPARQKGQSLDTYLEDIEREMLENALETARYNKTRAAELLGISFRSFRYKLKKFDID